MEGLLQAQKGQVQDQLPIADELICSCSRLNAQPCRPRAIRAFQTLPIGFVAGPLANSFSTSSANNSEPSLCSQSFLFHFKLSLSYLFGRILTRPCYAGVSIELNGRYKDLCVSDMEKLALQKRRQAKARRTSSFPVQGVFRWLRSVENFISPSLTFW